MLAPEYDDVDVITRNGVDKFSLYTLYARVT